MDVGQSVAQWPPHRRLVADVGQSMAQWPPHRRLVADMGQSVAWWPPHWRLVADVSTANSRQDWLPAGCSVRRGWALWIPGPMCVEALSPPLSVSLTSVGPASGMVHILP